MIAMGTSMKTASQMPVGANSSLDKGNGLRRETVTAVLVVICGCAGGVLPMLVNADHLLNRVYRSAIVGNLARVRVV
jgi:hypothetical protein